MKILIAEDSLVKREQLIEFIQSLITSSEVDSVASIKGATDALRANVYDLVLLDMSMPKFDAKKSRINPFAGRDILFKMKRLDYSPKAIIVTRFSTFGTDNKKTTLEELNMVMKSQFGDIYIGTILYSFTNSFWKKDLSGLIGEMIELKDD